MMTRAMQPYNEWQVCAMAPPDGIAQEEWLAVPYAPVRNPGTRKAEWHGPLSRYEGETEICFFEQEIPSESPVVCERK